MIPLNARPSSLLLQGPAGALLRNVLVATDGSANGDRAVSFALALAHRHGSELLLCYAVDHAKAVAECSVSNGGGELLMPLVQDLDDAAESILRDAAKRVTDDGVVAKTAVLDGPSAEAIVAYAKERKVDAIVMGTQGKGGLERLFLGSTADGVLRRAEVPVFVVPPAANDDDATFGRIFVAVDDSDPSDAAVDFALGLAAVDKAALVFCSVVQVKDVLEGATAYACDTAPMIEELHAMASSFVAGPMARAHELMLFATSLVAEGDSADQLLLNAKRQHADLIVIGTHGRRGLPRLVIGSVAESVVRRSSVAVVVLRGQVALTTQ